MVRLLFSSELIIRSIAGAATRRRFSSSSSSSKRLEGKVALITGGASGLGKATAQIFIQHGARVVIADINSQLGQEVSHDLGPQAQFVPCDVAMEAEVDEAVRFCVARHGKLDVMFNNAGIAGSTLPPSVADVDLDEFDRVMRVNVRGVMAGVKHAARVMIPAGSGSILCMGSISGVMGGLGPYPYSVSKFAVPGIVRSAASELCRHGVRINCISAAPIATRLVVEQLVGLIPGATGEEIVGMVNGLGELKGAVCEEEDVGNAALYLASEEAKFVTGHNLVVDGGFTSFKHLKFPKLDV